MNNTNESGRSMVEMLGVLAIIGVLSVMGIAGYTQAMKKYKTNEAIAAINMGAMLCKTNDTSVSDLARAGILTSPACSGEEFTFTLDKAVDKTSVENALGSLGSYSDGHFTIS